MGSGMGVPIMVLIIGLAFAMFLVEDVTGVPSPFSEMRDIFVSDAWVGTMNDTASGAGGIQAGTTQFPNAFTLFANVFLGIFSFFIYPYTIWSVNDLPTELRLLLSVLFGALYTIALVAWFRGGQEP